MTGVITSSYYGFALDNNGVLYIGKSDGINIYANGQFTKTVYKTPGGYYFTIQDEKLYVATSGKVLEMDLRGNLIEKRDDRGSQEIEKLHKQRNVFVTDDTKYRATGGLFGFYKITRYDNNGGSSVIYQSPILDFVLYLAVLAIAIISVILFIKGFIKWSNIRDEQRYKAMQQPFRR